MVHTVWHPSPGQGRPAGEAAGGSGLRVWGRERLPNGADTFPCAPWWGGRREERSRAHVYARAGAASGWSPFLGKWQPFPRPPRLLPREGSPVAGQELGCRVAGCTGHSLPSPKGPPAGLWLHRALKILTPLDLPRAIGRGCLPWKETQEQIGEPRLPPTPECRNWRSAGEQFEQVRDSCWGPASECPVALLPAALPVTGGAAVCIL